MDAGTIEQALPGLEHTPTEPVLKPGRPRGLNKLALVAKPPA